MLTAQKAVQMSQTRMIGRAMWAGRTFQPCTSQAACAAQAALRLPQSEPQGGDVWRGSDTVAMSGMWGMLISSNASNPTLPPTHLLTLPHRNATTPRLIFRVGKTHGQSWLFAHENSRQSGHGDGLKTTPAPGTSAASRPS